MGEIVHIEGAGKLLEDMLALYREGKIEGIVIGVLHKDTRCCESYWAGLTYLQRLGLAENLKSAISFVHRDR